MHVWLVVWPSGGLAVCFWIRGCVSVRLSVGRCGLRHAGPTFDLLGKALTRNGVAAGFSKPLHLRQQHLARRDWLHGRHAWPTPGRQCVLPGGQRWADLQLP